MRSPLNQRLTKRIDGYILRWLKSKAIINRRAVNRLVSYHMIKIKLDESSGCELIEIQGSKENREAFLAELNIIYSQFKHRQDLSNYQHRLIQKPCDGCGGGGL